MSAMTCEALPKSGFGLPGLLMALAILGFLATLSLPRYHHMQAHWQRKQIQGQLKAMALQLSLNPGATLANRSNPHYHINQSKQQGQWHLEATPKNPNTTDPHCLSLGINAQGEQFANGHLDDGRCWG